MLQHGSRRASGCVAAVPGLLDVLPTAMREGIQYGASVAPGITHQEPAGPKGHAAYAELQGRPHVTLSGAACVRLAGLRNVPEDIAQHIRRAASVQQQRNLEDRRRLEDMSVREAAVYFSVSERNIRHHCQQGTLEAYQLGGRWRITGWEIAGQRHVKRGVRQ
jgi:excisionase family DNA binding protein